MTDKLGARASHQALAVPVEPQERLAPSGFDPSRWRELGERCEQAAGPDREDDDAIFAGLGNCLHDMALVRVEVEPGEYDLVRKCKLCGDNRGYASPKFTASLDAAMTLASGFGGEVTFFKDGTAKAFLWQPYPMAVEAKAATPALALCAAALKARAAIATEARRAATVKQGAVHEGVGRRHRPDTPSLQTPQGGGS